MICARGVPGLLFRKHTKTAFLRVLSSHFFSTENSTQQPSKDLQLNSALYVSGAAAQYVTYLLEPHLDTESLDTKFHEIHADLAWRKLDLDLSGITRRWNDVQKLRTERDRLTRESENLRAKKADTREKSLEDASKIHSALKEVRRTLQCLEESTALDILRLPASLHPRTPQSDSAEIIFQETSSFTMDNQNPAALDNFVHYSTASARGYYLLGIASEMEIHLQNFFESRLEKAGFAPISAPHFFRPAILEGACSPFVDPASAFMVDTKEPYDSPFRGIFLTNEPLNVFAGFFTSSESDKDVLPHRLITTGRIYKPASTRRFGTEDVLYDPVQTNTVGFCIGYSDADQTDLLAESMVTNLKEIYGALDLPFRISLIPACQLHQHESLRFSIEVFSNRRGKYVPVGNVSMSDDYIGKRLRFHVGKSHRNEFLRTVHGSACHISPLIACIIDNTGHEGLCRVSERIKSEWP